MNKAVKMSMIGVVIIAGLVTAALVYFFATFDINDYRERIAEAVKHETGRTLVFKDKLALTVFPGIGVELGGVSLSNATGFGDKPMVEVGSARVSVRFFPLFVGDVRFGVLELDGLRLNLSRTRDGAANWDDLVGRSRVEKNTADKKRFSLEIEGIEVSDASLFWNDDKMGTHFVVSGMKLVTGRIYKGAPFPLTAGLDFECDNPSVKGRLSLTGKSSIDFDNREYGHMDMKLSLDAEGKDVPGGAVDAEMAVQFAALDFKSEHAQVNGLVLSGYGVTVRADGTVDGLTEGVRSITATLTADPFDARSSLEAMGMAQPGTADASALTKVGGMAEVAYRSESLEIKTMELDVDGTRIVGSGHYRDNQVIPAVLARLDVGELDLDRYLPPSSGKNAEGAGADERLFDAKGLRDIDADLEAKIARLRVGSMWFENMKATVKAKDGVIHASPITGDFYGGTLSAGLTVNATGERPENNVIVGMRQVNVGALSKDVSGDDAYQGVLDFNVAASCQGERESELLRTLDGKVSFDLADGVFPGVSLSGMAKETHASKDKGGEVVASKSDSTKFGSIVGTGVIDAGILKNRDLAVKAPGLRADGQGFISLPTRKIDYLLKVKLVASSEGQGGKASEDLYGVMVPIRVGGTLDNPRYWVSVTEYIKALGGAVIGTAGSIIGGAVGVIKGVGKAVAGKGEASGEESPKRKKFLGIF